MIRVAVVGAGTSLGLEALRALANWHPAEVVLAVDHSAAGKSTRELAGPRVANLTVDEKLGVALDRVETDVIIDFTHAAAAVQNAESALKRGVAPVIGLHMESEEVRDLKSLSRMYKLPVLVAPVLSVGAVLLAQFAAKAAHLLPDIHIVETSSEGTAGLLGRVAAEGVARSIDAKKSSAEESHKSTRWQDVPHTALKMRGSGPTTEVKVSGKGEVLTLRHDSLDLASTAEGIRLAVSHVRTVEGVVVGLEHIL